MEKLFSRKFLVLMPLLLAIAFILQAEIREPGRAYPLRFGIFFDPERSKTPLDGRVLLMISSDGSSEPRFKVSENPDTQLVFGLDVEGLKPGELAVIDDTIFGYPLKNIAAIPPGEYWIQALLHRYETFHRADGHVVKLPMDRGEGQQWNRAPGNFYSIPQKMRIDPRRDMMIRIELNQEIAPIPALSETKYVKYIKIQSKLLTEFWGRPMYLGAHVLVPHGFDEHPEARYPLLIRQGHNRHTFEVWRETPPDPDLSASSDFMIHINKPDYSKRFGIEGYNRIRQEVAYEFYKYWIAPDTPRMLIMEIHHANPYYDDSYGVNSANLGPYGDAITYELIPYIEKKFRGIGKGWARFMCGGSTGGWISLAVQIFYPDEYNGCWAACPDPIDFRAYTSVNIYEHKNAYYVDSQWKRTPRPGKRNYLGEVGATVEEMNHRELVLGTKSRSGDQYDIWQAVFSPVGEDGYPQPIWDKMTGEIDPKITEYWRENYDLRYILERDWKTLGPKLQGKIHIYCGDMDTYYLNNAVYFMEEFLENTKNPYYGGEVDYGDRAEHCWNGDHTRPNAISRLRYHQMFIPKILERIKKSAPVGADLRSWRH
jgi:hypothetical protein